MADDRMFGTADEIVAMLAVEAPGRVPMVCDSCMQFFPGPLMPFAFGSPGATVGNMQVTAPCPDCGSEARQLIDPQSVTGADGTTIHTYATDDATRLETLALARSLLDHIDEWDADQVADELERSGLPLHSLVAWLRENGSAIGVSVVGTVIAALITTGPHVPWGHGDSPQPEERQQISELMKVAQQQAEDIERLTQLLKSMTEEHRDPKPEEGASGHP